MLPCVCSVIDHRWRQNVVKTKKWHTSRRRVRHCCFYHSLTSSVIYHWTDPKATWNLFVFYTITEILRALWLADACYLLEDRCTNDVTAWRDPRAWSKFIAVSRASKDFQNSGPKQSEKYSALVEDFSEKETAEYQSQWETFNSAKHARSLLGKKLSKAAWKLFCGKVCGRYGKSTNADEWQRLNTFSCSLLSRITLQMK